MYWLGICTCYLQVFRRSCSEVVVQKPFIFFLFFFSLFSSVRSLACQVCTETEDVCVATQQVCASTHQECTSYSTVCVETSQTCNGYQSVCDGYQYVCDGYDYVCSDYDEDGNCISYDLECSSYSYECTGYHQECTSYSTTCSRYEQQCNAYQTVCDSYRTECTDYETVCSEYAYGDVVTVSGNVSATGKGATGVKVNLTDNNSVGISNQTTTDSNGNYTTSVFAYDDQSGNMSVTDCALGDGFFIQQCRTHNFFDSCSSPGFTENFTLSLSEVAVTNVFPSDTVVDVLSGAASISSSYIVKVAAGNTAPANCTGGTVSSSRTVRLTGLTPSTHYSGRLCATQSGITNQGTTFSFDTLSKQGLTFFPGLQPYHQIGQVDPDGLSWIVTASDTPNRYMTFGPYTQQFVKGLYKGIFTLGTNDNVSDSTSIATIDIVSTTNGVATVLATREVTRRDFLRPYYAQDFQLDFYHSGSGQIEARILFKGGNFIRHYRTILSPYGNLAPAAKVDTLHLNSGVTTRIDLLANDYEPNGEVMTVESVKIPSSAGTATLVSGRFVDVNLSQAGSVLLYYVTTDPFGLKSGQEINLFPNDTTLRVFGPNELNHQIGSYVSAANAWTVTAAQGNAYMAFGPYTTGISAGFREVSFSMAIDNVTKDNARVATLDVWDADSGKALATRDIFRTEFQAINTFRDFSFGFVNPGGKRLEFRVQVYGVAQLYLQNTTVSQVSSVLLSLAPGSQPHQLGSFSNDGDAWFANSSQGTGYLTFGPYTTAVPTGQMEATFSLKVDNNSADNLKVATVDIWDADSSRLVAKRDIFRKDFLLPAVYQEFGLSFENFVGGKRLEFRVFVYGKTQIFHRRTLIKEKRSLRGTTNSVEVLDARNAAFGHQMGSASGDGWTVNVTDPANLYLSYGPYRTGLTTGRYTAFVQLSVDNNDADDSKIAQLEIFDVNSNAILTQRTVTRGDFDSIATRQDFPLSFFNPANSRLEYRVKYLGNSRLTHHLTMLVPETTGIKALGGTSTNANDTVLKSFSPTEVAHQVGSLSGGVWTVAASQGTGYLSYGPYTTAISAGVREASFALSIDNNSANGARVATVDVWDADAGVALAQRDIFRNEFRAINTLQNFTLEFSNIAGRRLEFRVLVYGASQISLQNTIISQVSSPVTAIVPQGQNHQIGGLTADFDGWTSDGTLKGYLSFGPYKVVNPPGELEASFNLKVDNNSADNKLVATVDVWDADGGALLGKRDILRTEFIQANVFQEFGVTFSNTGNRRLEFRVQVNGQGKITHRNTTIKEKRTLRSTAQAALVVDAKGANAYHQIGSATAAGWSATPGSGTQRYLTFGPYVTGITQGRRTAYVALSVDNNTADNFPVAIIDVIDSNTGMLLSQRKVFRTDFAVAGARQDFPIAFLNPSNSKLEIRVFYLGAASLTHIQSSIE